jgi:hypothetical protein
MWRLSSLPRRESQQVIRGLTEPRLLAVPPIPDERLDAGFDSPAEGRAQPVPEPGLGRRSSRYTLQE